MGSPLRFVLLIPQIRISIKSFGFQQPLPAASAPPGARQVLECVCQGDLLFGKQMLLAIYKPGLRARQGQQEKMPPWVREGA